MCDEGMLSYQRATEDRVLDAARRRRRRDDARSALAEAKRPARRRAEGAVEVAIVLSAQHSNEDNFALSSWPRRSSAPATSSSRAGRSGKRDDILMQRGQEPEHARRVQDARPRARARSQSCSSGVLARQATTHVIALGAELPRQPPSCSKRRSQAEGPGDHRVARRPARPTRAHRAARVHVGGGRRHVRQPPGAWRRRASARVEPRRRRRARPGSWSPRLGARARLRHRLEEARPRSHGHGTRSRSRRRRARPRGRRERRTMDGLLPRSSARSSRSWSVILFF